MEFWLGTICTLLRAYSWLFSQGSFLVVLGALRSARNQTSVGHMQTPLPIRLLLKPSTVEFLKRNLCIV